MSLPEKSEHHHGKQRSLRRKLMSGVVLALLSVILYLQLDIIAPAFTSLILTPLSLAAEPGLFARLHVLRVIEYWIAALVWTLGVAIALRGLFAKRAKQAPQRVGATQRLLSTARERYRRLGLGLQVILLFAFVAAAAPFLASWDPTAQGSLPATRLLPPLTRAAYVEYTPVAATPTAGPISKRLADANNYLLNRLIRFSALEDDTILAAPSPEAMQVVRRGDRLFFLGTDHLGRDLASRIIYGTRVSLGIALVAAVGAVIAGAVFGFAAGNCGRIVERLLMRSLDVLLAIPSLFLILAVVTFLGSSIPMMIAVLIALGWMAPARIIRTEVASLREREDILTAKLLGVPTRRIVLAHMVPNILPVVLTSLLLQFSTMVLAEATLSFLGLGVQPPIPSWGSIIGEATGYLHIAWWIALFPGVAISTLIVGAHVALEGWQRGPGS